MTGAIPPLALYALMMCTGTTLPYHNDNKGKGKFTLEQAIKAQKGSRGIAVPFL
jgi:hypothetical protein